jgi:hypothetical protein
MRRLIEHCCGRPHASTSAEWFRHDSGSCGQEGNRLRRAMTQVANDCRQQSRDLKGLTAKDELIDAMGGTLE